MAVIWEEMVGRGYEGGVAQEAQVGVGLAVDRGSEGMVLGVQGRAAV